MVCKNFSLSSTTAMQNFFGLEQAGNEGIVVVPDWNYLRSGLQASLNTVTSYYRAATGKVDGSHFLIKLIFGVGVARSLPLDRFYAHCVAKTQGVAMANKMSCSVNNGNIFDGVFYGRGNREIIIANSDDFDFEEAALPQNWPNLEPIKVLKHPKSDLAMNLLDGNTTSNETGTAVISINIPMLALQYRQWEYEEALRAEKSGDSPRGVAHFIYNYPLPNMLKTHLDVCIFNRAYNLLNGIPFGESKVKHPFYLTDFSKRLNDVQMRQLDILRESRNRKFFTLLRMIPMVSEESLADLAGLPDVAPTRQVIWALTLSRLSMLSFLFKVTKLRPREVNSSEVSRILWNLSLYKTEKALQRVLPADAFTDAKYDLNILLQSS